MFHIPILYLSWRVCARDDEWYRAVRADSLKVYQIRGETLLVLGFALVGLCLGRRLEEMRSDKDMNPNEIIARRKKKRTEFWRMSAMNQGTILARSSRDVSRVHSRCEILVLKARTFKRQSTRMC